MSATLHGVEAIPVTVEVVISNGIPGISIVGMGDTAVQEAKERVKAAIQAAGFTMPASKIIINLAPGSLKKSGSGFDLPIAIGILIATGQIDPGYAKGKLYVGELSLEGPVRQPVGILAFGISAYKLGLDLVSSGQQYAPIDGLVQLGLETLGRLHLEEPFNEVVQKEGIGGKQDEANLDFRDIAGHEVAKRALQIAVAGNHGVLMVGPPGSGKTMLASRVPTILPPFEQDEMLQASAIHSVAGENIEPILQGKRPFRHPHHSISAAGLLGGGSPVRPGEISLAHCGVLFLDEIAEFRPSILQGLRQPMETGMVNITRADGAVEFPANFTLIAASNPCPCGYFGDSEHECKCSDVQISKYQSKIGGPLIDRIDIQLDIDRLPTTSVLNSGEGKDSKTLREKVLSAKSFSRWRCQKDGVCTQGCGEEVAADLKMGNRARCQISPSAIISSCHLDSDSRNYLETLTQSHALSGRGLINTLRVARTIADMEESEKVLVEHLAEAIGFRLRQDA